MEASLVIRPTAPLVPVRRWRACGWRGPARHVPDARLRPRRLPPGDRRGFRRRPNPWRDRIVLHPEPRGRRQAPRAAYRPRRLPRPPGNLCDLVPTGATMAEEPLARPRLLHVQLRRNRAGRDPPPSRRRIPRVEHIGGGRLPGVLPAHPVFALLGRPRPPAWRRRRRITGRISPESA